MNSDMPGMRAMIAKSDDKPAPVTAVKRKRDGEDVQKSDKRVKVERKPEPVEAERKPAPVTAAKRKRDEEEVEKSPKRSKKERNPSLDSLFDE